MSEPVPCQGCGAAIIVYPDDPYLATLTGDPTFPYFVLCPPGQTCLPGPGPTPTQGGRIFCNCYGHLLWADYKVGDNLVVIYSGLLTKCQDEHGGEGDTPDTSKNPLPIDSVPIYYNKAVDGSANCPAGNTFKFHVDAGTFIDRTQAAADAAALNYANQQSLGHQVCLGSLSTEELALNVAAGPTVTATGSSVAGVGNTWTVDSGALPTGLALTGTGPSVTLAGTPTVEGSFTFTLKIVTPGGDTNSRSYTMCIVEIDTTSPLPDATALTAYTDTLMAAACATTPLSWQVTVGALPPGLSLDEPTGVISGTPTSLGAAPIAYNFTITLQTSAT